MAPTSRIIWYLPTWKAAEPRTKDDTDDEDIIGDKLEEARTQVQARRDEASQEDDEEDKEEQGKAQKYPLGHSLQKYFGRHGIFEGTVNHYNDETGLYSTRYQDGDKEDMEEEEIDMLESEEQQDDDHEPEDKNKPPIAVNLTCKKSVQTYMKHVKGY